MVWETCAVEKHEPITGTYRRQEVMELRWFLKRSCPPIRLQFGTRRRESFKLLGQFKVLLSQGSGMASAAIWLDELGKPPRDVCLDWAWQIQAQFANTRHSTDSPLALSWQQIEVSEGGELLFPAELHRYSPKARLQELIAWTQSECSGSLQFEKSTTTTNDLENELRRLTACCFSELSATTDGLLSRSPVVPVEKVAFEPESFLPTCEPLQVRKPVKSAKQNPKFAKQFIGVLKQHKVAASILAAIVLIIVGYFFLSGANNVTRPKSTELSRKTEESLADNSSENVMPDLDDDAVPATMTEMPDLCADDVRAVPPVAMPSITSDSISGIELKQLDQGDHGNSSDVAVSREAFHEAAGNAIEPSGNRLSTQAPESIILTERDMMHELEVAKNSAELKPLESDLSASDSMDGNVSSEPLVLRTSPMVQVHKLAAKIKVRPRQPVWQILLSVDDEFELMPEEPQDISDRQLTTWLLSNSDAKSPKVRLVIQVHAAPGRQTALRWRVFAGSEDMPDLMLPLDKEILNPLQDRLRVYSQMSQREADRLKQLASTSEREVRTALSKQRVIMESQSKLASRLLTIVAEAQFLDDLLRSQLTVYAKLRDGVDANGQVLLQFGDSEARQKLGAESEKPANME